MRLDRRFPYIVTSSANWQAPANSSGGTSAAAPASAFGSGHIPGTIYPQAALNASVVPNSKRMVSKDSDKKFAQSSAPTASRKRRIAGEQAERDIDLNAPHPKRARTKRPLRTVASAPATITTTPLAEVAENANSAVAQVFRMFNSDNDASPRSNSAPNPFAGVPAFIDNDIGVLLSPTYAAQNLSAELSTYNLGSVAPASISIGIAASSQRSTPAFADTTGLQAILTGLEAVGMMSSEVRVNLGISDFDAYDNLAAELGSAEQYKAYTAMLGVIPLLGSGIQSLLFQRVVDRLASLEPQYAYPGLKSAAEQVRNLHPVEELDACFYHVKNRAAPLATGSSGGIYQSLASTLPFLSNDQQRYERFSEFFIMIKRMPINQREAVIEKMIDVIPALLEQTCRRAAFNEMMLCVACDSVSPEKHLHQFLTILPFFESRNDKEKCLMWIESLAVKLLPQKEYAELLAACAQNIPKIVNYNQELSSLLCTWLKTKADVLPIGDRLQVSTEIRKAREQFGIS